MAEFSIIAVATSNIGIATIVAVLAFFVGLRGRRYRVAHLLWLAVLVKLITPPILPVPVPVADSVYDQFTIKGVLAASGLTAGASDPSNSSALLVDARAPESERTRIDQTQRNTFASSSSISASRVMGARTDQETRFSTNVPLAAKPGSTGQDQYDAQSNRQASTEAWALNALQYATGVAVLVWIGVAIILISRGLWRFVALARLLQTESTVHLHATEFVQSLIATGRRVDCESAPPRGRFSSSAQTTVREQRSATIAPQVLLLPARIAPMLFGLSRWTYIVCPQDLWISLTPAQRDVFLAHETAHFIRRDHWKRWFEWVVSCIYWWCPLVYLANSQLVRFEEISCDKRAMRFLERGKKCYAETLLHVAEYLDSARGPAPQVASLFNSNRLLEERMRLIGEMAPLDDRHYMPKLSLAACCVLLAIHPIPFRILSSVEPQFAATLRSRTLASEPAPSAATALAIHAASLPAPPVGWWNQSPQSTWATIPLGEDRVLFAEAGKRLEVRTAGEIACSFEHQDVQAFAVLPDAERIVVGSEDGSIRVWSLATATPVTLIGKHAAPITSLAYHPQIGLVAGDAQGSVVRWDLQSGEIKTTWTSPGSAIQSLRASKDGSELAVLLGSWNAEQSDASHQNGLVHFLESHQLEPIRKTRTFADAAVVLELAANWWCVRWDGTVLPLEPRSDMQPIDLSGTANPSRRASSAQSTNVHMDTLNQPIAFQIPKHRVSEIVFCQDAGSHLFPK